MNDHDLARLIDHTLLLPHATGQDVHRLCAEAAEFEFASVCVLPSRVAQAAELLQATPVKVCTVIGFPLGASSTAVKLLEVSEALDNGAKELDMVVNLGELKDGQWSRIGQEIHAIREASRGFVLKVIFETGLLSGDEKVLLARMCKHAGVDFVKTSTGSTYGGATVEDVALLREQAGDQVGVKASGGIKTREVALAMIAAGATRLGTSSGLGILGIHPGHPRRHIY